MSTTTSTSRANFHDAIPPRALPGPVPGRTFRAGPAGDQSTWQSAFQQAKADHDFTEQELELKTNTQLTREIHTLTTELHRRLLEDPAQ